MQTYFNVAQIIVSLVLIGVLLREVRVGGLGGIFGQPDSTFRTRRGVEKTLFQFTIALVVLFVALSVVSLKIV